MGIMFVVAAFCNFALKREMEVLGHKLPERDTEKDRFPPEVGDDGRVILAMEFRYLPARKERLLGWVCLLCLISGSLMLLSLTFLLKLHPGGDAGAIGLDPELGIRHAGS